eukprot:TRINITY_DN3607_c0_g1_i2.p2 TRINITY_DN3607_c0_g1~~TRINITY_DN3607_c0_g1_i2.p2  ORF type:complete len:107 (+),score=33.12 TRINITY_DN3607_c0_g1_i2:136-456(+)
MCIRDRVSTQSTGTLRQSAMELLQDGWDRLMRVRVPTSAIPFVLVCCVLAMRSLQKNVEWFATVEPSYLLTGFMLAWFLARTWLRTLPSFPLKEDQEDTPSNPGED